MSLGIRNHSRFERRSLARQRRIQRRLDEVQQGRGQRNAARPVRRAISRPARLLLFAVSLLLGLGLARAVTATAFSWWSDEPAAVSAIAVQGTTRLSSAQVADAIGLQRGQLLSALAAEEIESHVGAHPWVRTARVAVLPTGTVIVDVEERQPRAVLLDDGSAWRYVDEDGVAFAEVAQSETAEAYALPALDGGTGASFSDAKLVDALALLGRLEALPLKGFARTGTPHRGVALVLPLDGERGWVLRRTDGRNEVILGNGDVDTVAERMERLERLLSSGLGELPEITSIDLRFAGQAVLRTEGASG